MICGDRVTKAAESIGFFDVIDLRKSQFGILEEGRIVDVG